jgi:hypothetical protein
MKALDQRRKEFYKKERIKKKAQLGLYLNTNHVFSYNGINDFIYTAVRGIGKSVISVETAIILKRKYGYDNVKCFYFRLTDQSVKAMLANKAEKAIDPYLIDKYDLDITAKGNKIFDHGKLLIEFYPLVSAGSKGKGVNLYDCNFFKKYEETGQKTFIVTIWDEFLMAEGVEKKSVGDPVEQYKIYREAILRDAQATTDYNAVYNFLLANNVSECAAVTGALYNYIPNPKNHKRVKLTRKRAMFWNVPITAAYKEKRKNSYNANILDYENDVNYSDVERDLSLVKPKKTRIHKVTALYKFDKFDKKKWFCLYDGIYIRQYHNETVNKSLVHPMKRYLDEIYNADIAKHVFDRFDARGFKYCDIMSMALFQAQLKLLKAK